jgi:hypothetical protein
VRVIGIEAGQTILLERERVAALASELRISLFGL